MTRDQEIVDSAWVFMSRETGTSVLSRPETIGLSIELVLWILCLVILFMATASARTTGRVSGTLKDRTGAVIPQSSVTAINIAANLKQKTTADASGIFVFRPLAPGLHGALPDQTARWEGTISC